VIQIELENAAALKDRLDEAKHEIDKLRKVANQVEKYKKQAEEGEDLQRQLHVCSTSLIIYVRDIVLTITDCS
jgi:chromosome segregation ATPase